MGIQKIHKLIYVRGVVQGGVDMEEEKTDLREKLSGQALIEKNKKMRKETQKLNDYEDCTTTYPPVVGYLGELLDA